MECKICEKKLSGKSKIICGECYNKKHLIKCNKCNEKQEHKNIKLTGGKAI
jgi:hypothetical protein